MKFALIAICGLAGVFARYFVGDWLHFKTESLGFPVGTFVINVVGCFLIGVVYVLGIERAVISPEWRVGLMVGFMGGFTTFSSYSLETVLIAKSHEYVKALLYASMSVVIGVGCTIIGIMLTRFLTRNI